jgi:type III pantothenate kinase
MKFTVIDPDLTLDGLRLLSLRNKAPPLPRDRTPFVETE